MSGRATLASGIGWTTLAALTLTGAGAAAARPDGWALGLARPLPLLAAAVGLSALAVLTRGTAGRLAFELAWVPLLLALGSAIPGVKAWTGPPLLALAAAVAAGGLVRARWVPSARAFLPSVLALYAVVALRTQSQVGPEGDEPHYLMVTESLLRDGDVALEADYAEGRYRNFHPRELAPHYRVRGRDGEIYSLHAIGLSLLLFPAYALGGYSAASMFMAILAALLAREVRELVRDVTERDDLAEGVGWLMALSPPLVHYAGLIFTEVPAALVVAIGLRQGRRLERASAVSICGWGAAVAFLPWLHVRYAALAGLLGLFALAQRPPRRAVALLGACAALSAAGLMLYHAALYGSPDPQVVWGRRPEFAVASLPHGIVGLLLDQEFGLLPYAPVFCLALPGLVLLARSRRSEAAAAALILVTALALAGSWHMWRGGWNPPARFLVPALPALAVAVAAVWNRGFGVVSALLVGWGVWTGLAGGLEPRLVHRDRDGQAPLFRVFSGAEEWTRLLPGFVLEDSARDRTRLAAVWAALLGLASIAALRPRLTGARFGVGVLGVFGATGIASLLSHARTEGRDAVRAIGRPAIGFPAGPVQRRADALWTFAELDGGRVYEPHRHPGGAALGSRLPLPPGRYALELTCETVGGGPTPALEIVTERRFGRGAPRRSAFGNECPLEASFDLVAGEQATSLLLVGGSPLLLKQMRLRASTFPGTDGLME